MSTLRVLGFSQTLEDLMMGKLEAPLASFSCANEIYPYPPAFTPILNNDSDPSYIGIWYRGFWDNKLSSFVEMDISDFSKLTELARTEEQLYYELILRSIIYRDEVLEDAQVFAKTCGIDIEKAKAVAFKTDDPKEFIELECFQSNTPLNVIVDWGEYDGGFPLDEYATSFEASQDVLPNMVKSWMPKGKNVVELFNQFETEKKYDLAWLVLNTTGWNVREAQEAVAMLMQYNKDIKFHSSMENWLQKSKKFVEQRY